MIARLWRGIARTSEAERYVEHLRTATFPQLATMSGFVAASILRRDVAAGVEFRVITTWQSIEAIQEFAGADSERAVVPNDVRAMMVAYDEMVEHYDIVD